MDTLSLPLVRTQKAFFTGGNLFDVVRSFGVSEDDDLCVHSAIHALGLPSIRDAEQLNGPLFLGAFADTLKRVVRRGTLLMPTFTYSFCKGERYDVQCTPSTVGVLTDYFRKMCGVKRTGDPIFSFAVSGAREKEYLDISDACFGDRSVFDRLYKNGAKMLALGCSLHSASTFVHYVEKLAGVPYRFDKIFSGVIVDDGIAREHRCTYFVRYLDRPSIFSEEKLRAFLLKTDNLEEAPFGVGTLMLYDARRLCDDLLPALRRNPVLLLSNEAC